MKLSYEIQDFSMKIEKKNIISHLNKKVFCGEIVIIDGKNGAGKSTLMKKIISELESKNHSSITSGKIRKHFSSFAYLEQSFAFDPTFPLTVKDVVEMGLFYSRISRQYAAQSVDKALSAVHLSHKKNSQISDLSGGEIQRMRFARLILQDADAIFLDEPFVNIDVEMISVLVDLLLQWKDKSVTIITHDASELIEKHANHIICLN